MYLLTIVGDRENLIVTHVGFLFSRGDELIFRHASSDKGKVVDVALTDYVNNGSSSLGVTPFRIQRPRQG